MTSSWVFLQPAFVVTTVVSAGVLVYFCVFHVLSGLLHFGTLPQARSLLMDIHATPSTALVEEFACRADERTARNGGQARRVYFLYIDMSSINTRISTSQRALARLSGVPVEAFQHWAVVVGDLSYDLVVMDDQPDRLVYGVRIEPEKDWIERRCRLTSSGELTPAVKKHHVGWTTANEVKMAKASE